AREARAPRRADESPRPPAVLRDRLPGPHGRPHGAARGRERGGGRPDDPRAFHGGAHRFHRRRSRGRAARDRRPYLARPDAERASGGARRPARARRPSHRRKIMTTSRLLALLVLSVIGAAPAPAGDRCLQGTSVLTDQRALATLRADEDSACPCTTTGGRSAYRRCARAVVNAAVDGGSVRRECKKTAKRDVSSATCGTSDETCGGSRPTKPGADATCTVRSASSCHDRGSTQSTACAAETHCSDVVTWTAGTCLDGRQAGPWHV